MKRDKITEANYLIADIVDRYMVRPDWYAGLEPLYLVKKHEMLKEIFQVIDLIFANLIKSD